MWLKKNVILLSGAPCLRDLAKDKVATQTPKPGPRQRGDNQRQKRGVAACRLRESGGAARLAASGEMARTREVAMPQWNRLRPFSFSLAFSITLVAMALVLGGCGGHCGGNFSLTIIQNPIFSAQPSPPGGATQKFKVSGGLL